MTLYHSRTQVFEVSTLYGAATLAAALDTGAFGPPESAHRMLLVSNNAVIPETAAQLSEMHGWDRVAARFDRVLDYNREIHPYHPSVWVPTPTNARLLRRLLHRQWEIGDGPVELVVETLTAAPAKALADIFADADVHVYAEGLMSYGPTRNSLPQHLTCRIQRLLHLDLVPGLTPLLLSEHGVPPEVVPMDAFRAVLDELTETAPALPGTPEGEPTAIILGQYLAAINVLTEVEEEQLHERMLRGAAAAGHRCVLFKPHPTAPARYSQALEKAAADAGVSLTVLQQPMLAETLYGVLRPKLVVSCFSTALLTAATCYGIPVARAGTDLLLERLTPYENSNRVPVTIVDTLVPEVGGTERTRDSALLSGLLTAVGYCMQPEGLARLRPDVEAWLEAHLDAATRPYFTRGRLTALQLPGGIRIARIPGARKALRSVGRLPDSPRLARIPGARRVLRRFPGTRRALRKVRRAISRAAG